MNATKLKQSKELSKARLHRIFVYRNDDSAPYALVPILSMVLASFPTLHSTIDDLYEKNPKEHFAAYNKSKFRDFERLNSLSVDKEYYAKRLLGLFEHDLANENDENTLKLFKTVKSRWYKQAKILQTADCLDSELIRFTLFPIEASEGTTGQYQNKISVVEDVRTIFAKKHTLHTFMLDEKLRFELLMIFLARGMNRPVDFSGLESRKKIPMLFSDNQLTTDSYLQQLEDAKKEKLGDYFYERVKDLSSNADFETKDIATFEALFGFSDVMILDSRSIDSYDLLELIRYVELIENYTLPDVYLPKNRKEAEKEISLLLSLSPYKKTEKLEETYYVYFGVFLMRIIQEFKKSKELFFHNENTESLLEIDWLKEELKKEKERSNGLSNDLLEMKQQQRSQQKEEQSKWAEENKRIEELNRLLKEKDAQIEEQKEELHSLREYVYETEQDKLAELNKTSFEGSDIEAFTHFINDRKIVVIGGHPTWQHKLNTALPNLIMVDRRARFDLAPLRDADFVYFQTDFMNHGLSYRAIPVLREWGTPFGFLPKGNIDIGIRNMKSEWEKKIKE